MESKWREFRDDNYKLFFFLECASLTPGSTSAKKIDVSVSCAARESHNLNRLDLFL